MNERQGARDMKIKYHLMREYDDNLVDWHYCMVIVSHRGMTYEQAVEHLTDNTFAGMKQGTTYLQELPDYRLETVELDCISRV